MGTVGSRRTSPRSSKHSSSNDSPPGPQELVVRAHHNDGFSAKTTAGALLKLSPPHSKPVVIGAALVGQALARLRYGTGMGLLITRILLTLGVLCMTGFALHRIWTKRVDLIAFLRTPSNAIPVKETQIVV